MTIRGFTVSPARYAKGKMLVRVHDSHDGLKGRASYLCDALNARYTHREGGYILSPAAAEKLIALYDAGYDGCLRFSRSTPAEVRIGYGPKLSIVDALKAIGFKPQRLTPTAK